jgi:hypothetical protein
MVSDDEMTEAIEQAERDPARAAEALVAAANAHGGEDNVTVVLFDVVEGEQEVVATAPRPAPEDLAAPPDAGGELDGRQTAADGPGTGAGDSASPAGLLRRHGAGKGGRLPAILLVLAVLVLALLVLYWGATR